MKKCKFITAENSELTLENKKMTYCGVISHLKMVQKYGQYYIFVAITYSHNS
ncbi:hypothetical protein [Clostridium saccharobutylicum]|nr:hypothetical protein [Clostridium saccharobutylicum]AQR90846.1 hypothetical protein CLOSC_25670 [Clostridium saccharobutylicum]AQS00750.1 hypothetical protein CSACC_25740 [Clostridium saccharobutylicum]AQS14733.1 hypothetical protein CLOSACC_25740 [Clostridium saccharobutylicum]MBA2906003.1 hypothetical protein [Clostridium saccharobutylicum]MBA8790555.1 hypothetical protein [Clostridium saccharobutylicum]